ncbi:MAG: flagellar filament capping protein FliD [Halarcobacter sp.]
MANGVLGLGSGQAASLNQDVIDKLKEADRASKVAPLEARIEDITSEGGEAEKIAEITAKANELLDAIKPFDLYVTNGVTAFDQKTASTSGDSAVFDAADESKLNVGTTTIDITTLAKRDVFQSDVASGATKDADLNAGDLNIAIAGSDGLYSTSYTIDTTGKTYQEIANEINTYSDLTASVEQVGDDSYRLVVKSADSGLENELKITGDASSALGYTTDGTTEKAGSNVQPASNLEATVNGVAYDVSTNTITVDNGLKITAVSEGVSTISIENDTTTIEDAMQSFVDKYNEFVALVDTELYDPDSKVDDKSTLRTMMSSIKNYLFGSYGTDSDLSIFNFGFGVDKYGSLSLDSTEFNDAIKNNMADLKDLFLGKAESEGLGTQLKTYVDALDGFDGLLYQYQEHMVERQQDLEEEKTKAEEDLDNKYSLMSEQFAAYGAIITQFEAQFSGLRLMIQQSTAQ